MWLLVLAAPIVAAHFYRGRIRRLPVPSLLFWDQVLLPEERKSAFRKLRRLLGLIWALAALALLTSALADPTVRGLTPEPRRYALVIDTSPELFVREPDGRLRFDLALDRARELLARLGRVDTAAIIDATGVVEPETSDRHRRTEALERISRDPIAEDPARLAACANPEATLYVLTSRPWPAMEDRNLGILPVGTPQANTGLTQPRLLREEGRLSAQVTAVNASDAPAQGALEARNRGRVFATFAVSLQPRERKAVEVPLDPQAWPAERFERGAFIELRLATGDAHPEDDVAAFVVPPTAPVPVLLVSDPEHPDPHLWSALQLLEQEKTVTLSVGRPSDPLTEGAVVIFDRTAPSAPLPDGGYLLLGSEGPHAPAAAAGEASVPKIVDWDRDHPIHRWVEYGDVLCRRARLLEGNPLVLSDRGAIATWGRRQGLAWIQFGFSFRVEEGDFALKASFPIFLRNALAWLSDEGRRAFPRTARAGGVLRNVAPLAEPGADVRITEVRQDRTDSRSIEPHRGEARVLLPRSGLVKIECGGRTEWVAVEGTEPLDAGRVPDTAGPGLPEPPPWWKDLPYPAVVGALGLLMLAAEWIFYQRGWI